MSFPVDAHVHFHRLDRVAPTLEAAAANFEAAGGRADGLVGLLLLTQMRGETVFESLAAAREIAGWTFSPASDERETLIARRGRRAIGVVCGRQVRAADGLEVLALGTIREYPDGLSFADTVAQVSVSGALTVLPWGFGKWWGRRGQRVASVLTSFDPNGLFLGDNGSRLAWQGMPPLIRRAQGHGFRVLPGTDPFPVAGDHRRVGGFGLLAEGCLPESAPWATLRAWLLALHGSPTPYGRACDSLQFLRNQIAIRTP